MPVSSPALFIETILPPSRVATPPDTSDAEWIYLELENLPA